VRCARAGLVTNLRRGENLTGVTCINADLDGKRVELIRKFCRPFQPCVLLNPDDKRSVAELKEVELAAKASSIALLPQAVVRPMTSARHFRGPPIPVPPAPSSSTIPRCICIAVNWLTRAGRRIATVFNFRNSWRRRADVIWPERADMCRQSARLIKKALNGELPAKIPMEQPTRFELVVNLKTAKQSAS